MILTGLVLAFYGAVAHADTITRLTYQQLTQTPESDGTLFWCTNCNQVAPCTGPVTSLDTQGVGAFALGYSGAWQCSSTTSTFNPAIPGAIGGTTPAAGHFTTLSASGTSTLATVNATSIPAAGAIGGTTPAAGTFTALNATSAPSLGAIGGTTPAAVTGTVITGTTSVNASAVGDEALAATNGGHISSLLGTGTLPTVDSGTVTAGGTDNAMEVTGSTSPATVTFHTAFHAKPICQCGDETAALGACKQVANSNGATVVVTTTGTDSFTLTCVGK